VSCARASVCGVPEIRYSPFILHEQQSLTHSDVIIAGHCRTTHIPPGMRQGRGGGIRLEGLQGIQSTQRRESRHAPQRLRDALSRRPHLMPSSSAGGSRARRRPGLARAGLAREWTKWSHQKRC
jgi:hypothetical protein